MSALPSVRGAEFLCLYVLAPLIMAVALPPGVLFPALFAVSALGMILLHFTAGFRWRDLVGGMAEIRLPVILVTAALTSAASLLIIAQSRPDALFSLPRFRPGLMVMITLLYPVLSVLPQELVYRPLYFRRYGHFLPSGSRGLMLNAALFSLAHLMYWSALVAAMTFLGGLIFAWAYETRRSFPLAMVLHSVAGIVLFAVGMGAYFYSGNVTRPF